MWYKYTHIPLNVRSHVNIHIFHEVLKGMWMYLYSIKCQMCYEHTHIPWNVIRIFRQIIFHIPWFPLNHIPFSISHSPYSPDCTHMHILWHPRDRHTYSHILHTGLHVKSECQYTHIRTTYKYSYTYSRTLHTSLYVCAYIFTLYK